MAYDTSRKRAIAFGGSKEDGGTWEWDGSVWVQVADIGPSPRQFTALAYDSARSRLVLFGGGEVPALSDTWEWDGAYWTQVADTGPAARSGHAMVYDLTRQRVILHGGVQYAGTANTLFQDTWEWNGIEWSQIADSGPMRAYHAMAFDSSLNRSWLFGGLVGTAPETFIGDTWKLADTSWTKIQDMGPGPISAEMVYAGKRTVLFGGGGVGTPGDTWEWNGTLWTERQNMGPQARSGHALAYDSDRDRVVLFGGATNSQGESVEMGDTWELTISTPD